MIPSSFWCLVVLTINALQYFANTLAVSDIVSPLARWVLASSKIIDFPPNSFIANSNDTLVLVDGFSKS